MSAESRIDCVSIQAGSTPNPAGTIDLIGGEVRIVPVRGQPRRAAVGDAVSEGDSLVTGKDSEAYLTMRDAGFIALRPNTRFKVVRYTADGGDDGNGVFSLLVGGIRSVQREKPTPMTRCTPV